jgi:thermopsin
LVIITAALNRKNLAFLIVLPLLIQAPLMNRQGLALPSGSSVYPFVLPSSYYENLPVDTFAETNVVEYSMISNTSISVAFMTSSQFQAFTGNGPVSNSIVYQNGTSRHQDLHVPPGSYDILVYAYAEAANATLSLTVSPNNPLVGGPLSSPEPTGVASFGLANQSGIDSPYSIASTDIVGFAAITSMEAYNSTGESVGANPSGATLQMNSVLVVNEVGGESQVYWCQNTPDLVTSAHQVAMADNVWNFSSSGFLSNDSITSESLEGSVHTSQQSGMTQYYYSYEGSNSSYSLPLGLVLLVNATVESGIGVLVEFGAHMTGSQTDGGWFDNVTIHDPTVQSAYFLTSGNDTTPNGSFYDTELVFGGEGNGEATSFTQLVSSLGLFYANGTGATLTPFPSYFSFGQNTYESADNLMAAYLGNGEVRVLVGAPDYAYLGAASGATSALAVEQVLGFPGVSNIGLINSTASPTTSIASTPSGTGTTRGGVPVFPIQFGGIAVFLVFFIALYLIERRHWIGRAGGNTLFLPGKMALYAVLRMADLA